MATPFTPDEANGPRSNDSRGRRGEDELHRGDIEQVRARRVERADLVREILEKKQADDDPGAAGWSGLGQPDPVNQPGESIQPDAIILPNQIQPAVRPEPVFAPAGPSVPADQAIPATLHTLAEWRDLDQREHAAVRKAQDEATSPRQRDKLDPASDFLRALRASGGADFLRRLIDDVIRPDDLLASGFGLSDLRDEIPPSLTPKTRRFFKLGAFAGPGIPFVAVPAVRRGAQAFFGDALTRESNLETALASIHEQNGAARVVPLSDAVLGDVGMDAVLERVRGLIANPAVTELELTWSDFNPQACDWNFEGNADQAAMRYATLLQEAMQQNVTLLLRATSSRDLELVIETVIRAMDFHGLERAQLGVVVPVDFPDSSTLLRRLTGRAHLRREDGGAPVRVSLYRLADRAQERADAVLHGWKVASYVEDADVDANMFRTIDALLAPEHRGVIDLEVSGEVRMDAVFAAHLGRMRENYATLGIVLDRADASEIRARFQQFGVRVCTRVPLIPGDKLRPAGTYLWSLVTRAERDLGLHEAAHISVDGVHSEDERVLQAMARMHQVHAGPVRSQVRIAPEDAPGITASIPLELFPEGLLEDEPSQSAPAERSAQPTETANETTVLGSRAEADTAAAGVSTIHDPAAAGETREVRPTDAADQAKLNPADTGAAPNLTEVVLGLRRGRLLRNTFRNDPASDPTIRSTRDWAARVQRRAAHSELGVTEAASHKLKSAAEIDEVLSLARAAGEPWSQTSGWERAARLEQIAKAIDANRARLIEVAMNETSLTFAEVDADVSKAVDLANFDAHLARQLDRMQGAQFDPVKVTLAVPGWIPPVSSNAATIFGALGAGSAVVLKASARTARTAAVLARVLWSTDLPADLLQVVSADHGMMDEDQFGRQLIVDQRIERVLMQGAYVTAARFLEWRPDLPLLGSVGGKSTVVVTPAADYDQAAAEIARSLVTATGQMPLRPSTVILVGAAARSERFIQQLADAVTSTRTGYTSDPSVQAGPLMRRANGKALAMLTELTGEEKWLVQPRSLDDTGRLWTPGIRTGLAADSTALQNDAPVPVINILTARTLEDAIEIQNRYDYGLGAGLFSLDRAEIAQWVQGVEAGNLYVNRDVLGNQVQRQPSGGWKESMIGTKLKSGGPNTLIHLGRWRADEHEQSHTLHLRGLEEPVARLIEALQPGMSFDEFERVRRTALSCQIAWNEEFGEVVDATNLPVERNLFRYRPAPCVIRFSEDGTADELGQVLVAATVARARIMLSTAWPLPPTLARELELRDSAVRIESNAEFLARIAAAGLTKAPRLRLIGGSRSEVCGALENGVDIAVFSDDVTLAGRIEMLPFLREQSISICAHRHGRPDARMWGLFPHETVRDPDASLLGRA
ncbi:aldehyde dehydrogenase family protein [Gulosibacter chungangensis]|uniref:Aldehyde dehydrogenase family protein n=1 Tax=Gulosibacter chungangensis TaxID=979746 RepID=A0A7J5BHU6_9MICO|nr:aldehyde dehydrogenase family protein [Gulosibacter chungangensis]KAB1645009.1 aldehyde dehydrogenase family protein [Gulosibacter chungangensis]